MTGHPHPQLEEYGGGRDPERRGDLRGDGTDPEQLSKGAASDGDGFPKPDHPAPNPSDRGGEAHIRSHSRRHGLDAWARLDGSGDLGDLREGTLHARREEVREETEGHARIWAVPSRNQGTFRPDPLVGGVTPEATISPGVRRAVVEICLKPPSFANVPVAGEPRRERQLHRHRARRG